MTQNNPPKYPANKNILKSRGMVIPWETLVSEGDWFFVPKGDEKDRATIWMAASRRKIKISTEVSEEGLTVWKRA